MEKIKNIISVPHYVYMLECADGTFYTGCTNNLERRFGEHSFSRSKGAKYTRQRRPLQILFWERYPDIRSARRREYEIKQMTRREKERLLGF